MHQMCQNLLRSFFTICATVKMSYASSLYHPSSESVIGSLHSMSNQHAVQVKCKCSAHNGKGIINPITIINTALKASLASLVEMS